MADNTTREKIIQTATDLIENQGYHATGINEIVRESGAPKGSIYYHFPEGKDGITAEAVRFAGETVADRIRANLSVKIDPAQSVQTFLETIAHYVEVSGFRSGGPLTIVASETATTNENLNQTCREAYDRMRAAFSEIFLANGFSNDRTESLVWMITSATEGAIILSRTYHSGDPLRIAAKELAVLIRNCDH
ncbi:MAG: TetR family transcriptional regulator [Anaerolineaceae bacterium]|nr:TetR family transcriptional regulator [Anaerolineaceae bacterium]